MHNMRGDTMTDLAESIESMEQLAVAWRAMVLDRDADADVRDLPGIAVRWADSRFAFWNAITLTDVGADEKLLRHRLTQTADIMRTKKRPGFLWLFEDLLDERARSTLEETAKQAGLQYSFPGTGMAGDILPIPDPVHPDLTFVRVNNDAQLQAYADINSRGYGFSLEDGRDGLVGSALWKSEVHAYLAMRGDLRIISVEQEVRALGGGPRGISLGAFATAGVELLPFALRTFRARHPDVRVALTAVHADGLPARSPPRPAHLGARRGAAAC
jgi:hypothetical protein